MEQDATDHLNAAFLEAMDAYEERPCFLVRHGKRFRKITYRQFRTLALRLAGYLHDQGVVRGERVALIADNSLDWMVTFIATLLSGGVIVPLRVSLQGDALHYVLQDSGARVAVLQQAHHIAAVEEGLADETVDRLFDLQHVLVLGQQNDLPADFVQLKAALSATRHLTGEEIETAVRQRALQVESTSLAAIHYVSGSAGQPWGAVFEHEQMFARLQATAEIFPFDQHDLVYPVSTWGDAHSLTPSLHCFLHGIPTVVQPEEAETLLETLQQTSPTVLFATPHSLEQYYANCMAWLSQQPESNQKVFQWALGKGLDYFAAGSEASADLAQAYRRAELTFFTQLRGQMGGRLRLLYSTGATLTRQLTEFYEAIGMPVLNLYSLAQTGGFPAANQPGAQRRGSAGHVAPGFEIRVGRDNEILVQGDMVMRRYWRRPQETEQAFDEDGWLFSGDQGYLDEDGYLFITGRKEYVIVLSVGRKISPAPIEAELASSPFVAETAVFGDDEPYLTALILPDMDAVNNHLQAEPPLADVRDERVQRLFDDVVAQLNAPRDRWERIEAYRLLHPAHLNPGVLSENGRHVLAERFAAELKRLYPSTQALQVEEVSQVQVDPERLRSLLEKESILDAWMEDAGIEFLFDLARYKQIDAPSMIHVCDIAATIAQIESEEKPLSTAIIVGDPVRISQVLPESQVQLLYHDHIRRMRNVLVTLAKMVDGMVLGYVLDRYGYVRGIHKLNVPLEHQSSLLLGPQFRHHAAISAQCDALVFFVPYGGKQVRVFANGKLVGRYANGDWYPENIAGLDRSVAILAEKRGYDLAVLRRLLRVAFRMSENNRGAIFMLGSAERILTGSDAAETSSFATILSAPISEMSDEELVNFAMQDGATIIDKDGRFRGCMILLRPNANTLAELAPGKGARHSSAAKMSKEADCLAITVSQDGPITVYDGGRRVLSL